MVPHLSRVETPKAIKPEIAQEEMQTQTFTFLEKKLPQLLIYWQSWQHLKENKLVVNVGDHNFGVHTCTKQIDVAIYMTDSDLKVAINTGIEFGGVCKSVFVRGWILMLRSQFITSYKNLYTVCTLNFEIIGFGR